MELGDSVSQGCEQGLTDSALCQHRAVCPGVREWQRYTRQRSPSAAARPYMSGQ